MIPILYDTNETTFTSNGLGRLRDAIEVKVTEERNSIYEADFQYPVTGANFDRIKVGRIIGVTHNESEDIQPFDIVSYEKPINGIVTFHCTHISYRQSYMTVTGSNINSLADAFTLLGNAEPTNPFTYQTDKTSSAYMSGADGKPKSVRSLLGGTEGSILDTYGGEYEWDKFKVILHNSRGETRPFSIRYGVNLLEYNEDFDTQGSYSSCIPYWTDGTNTVVGDRQFATGVTITDRGECVPLDVSDKFESQPSKADVEAMGLAMMASKNVFNPTQTIHVEFARLQDVPDYENFRRLYQCNLCDTINVVFPDYKSTGQFKIVKTVWDVLKDKYESMELGDLSISLSQALGIDNSSSYSGSGGGGGGGTSNYNDLENKPSINGTTLSGNKTSANLSIHEVPSGGSSGQVLTKNSGTDYDLKWSSFGGISDVQVNGTSVVTNNVADVPVAKSDRYGVVKVLYDNDPPGGVVGITFINSINQELTGYAPLSQYVNGAYQPIRAKFLPDATQSTKGAISASDKTKLDGIASGAEVNVQSDWTEADSSSDAFILNKPTLATVATSGSYNDLSDKPTIPTVNNATLTIQANGTTVNTFTANASTNVTADISVPTVTSDLFNDSGFITSADLPKEYDFTTSLTPSIDARGVTAKAYTVTPADTSQLTVENCRKLSAYLISSGGGGTEVKPLIVTDFTVSSSTLRIYVKSIYGSTQSTTSISVSGTLHVVAPFEISNVTAYTPM